MAIRAMICAALVMALAGCSDLGPIYTMECKLVGPAVGKSEVRFPMNQTTKTILWSTRMTDPVPVTVTDWTESAVAGTFRIADSYSLTLDLAKGSASLDSVSLAAGGKASSSGPCEKVEATAKEKALLGAGQG